MVKKRKTFNVPVDLIVLAGPTASGKTSVSISLADYFEPEIISCDSRQVYKYFTIGTAKPEPDELERVPHHLLDWLEPNQIINASDYMVEARRIIDQVIKRGKIPLLVGGTGLYIKAVLQGIFSGPPTNLDYRRELLNKAKQQGTVSLHEQLAIKDPDSAAKIDPRDVQRVLRALEVCHITGTKMSKFQKQHQFNEKPYAYFFFYLNRTRSDLYNRINQRIDKMIDQGWVKEVESLMNKDGVNEAPPMSSIGYRHLISYLNNRLDFDEAIESSKRETRRYAKRQISWFKKEKEAIHIEVKPNETPQKTAKNIINYIRNHYHEESNGQ